MNGQFEMDFFRSDERYGPKVAIAYDSYIQKNPLEGNTTMTQRMEHMAKFCKKAKLRHPETYLEIEQARDEKKMGSLRHYAACAIMIRGESVPVSPTLREKIRKRVQGSS